MKQNKQYLIMKLLVMATAGLLMIGSSSTAFATTGAEFLRQDGSPNASLVMAGVAAEDGSALMVINPAGILGQDIASLSFTHFASFVETAYEQIEYLVPLNRFASLAGRIFYDSTYNLMEIDEFGESVGTVRNFDLLVQTVYARSFGKNFNVGTGLKLFQSELAGYQSTGGAIDIGGHYKFSSLPITVGASIQNIGIMSAYDTQADQLPITIACGGMYKLLLGQHQINILTDFSYVIEDYSTIKPVISLQYKYLNNAFIKTAYRLDEELGNIMIGAGVRWSLLGLDYSYQPYGDLGDNHRITLSYYFKPIDNKSEGKKTVASEAASVQTLQAKPMPRKSVPKLKILPRIYSGKVSIFPTIKINSTQAWRFDITDKERNLVRVFSGKGKVPSLISWDGTDYQGQTVAQDKTYFLKIFVDKKLLATYSLPNMVPAVILKTDIKQSFNMPVAFRAREQLKPRSWQLSIIDADNNSIQAKYEGSLKLPRQMVWFKNTSQQTSSKYIYQLKVAYSDKLKIVINEPIREIMGQVINAPDDYYGIKIKEILFDFDKAELKPEVADKIHAAEQLVSNYSKKIYTICEGHADEIGSRSYNQKLSERRAHMVADKLLRDTGSIRDYITIAGYGKTQPENTLGTEDGLARNRRVEIILFIPKELFE